MNRAISNANAAAVPDQDSSAVPTGGHSLATGRMMSLADVADLLDVSIATARRRVAEGALRVHKIGRTVRISEHDLATFLEASRKEVE